MATVPRHNTDIIKGSKLMVFIDVPSGVTGSTATTSLPIGFATNHSLSMTTNTTQVSTKDHGDFPATLAQNITWECSAENLYSDAGEKIYMQAMKTMQPVHLVFAEASNYSNTQAQEGLPLIDNVGATGVTTSEWQYTSSTKVAEGDALITSLSINAPAGDNATMSVTFTGNGDLDTFYVV